MREVNWTALIVFVLLFGFITWLGFAAARWRKGDLDLLHEWGLGGRRFGTVITWFLVGGDAYTAYTFVAVPALAFGVGALAFFAVPYTILVYPILFIFFPRLWNVCRKHGYITSGDFVRGRFGNRWLALARWRSFRCRIRFWSTPSCSFFTHACGTCAANTAISPQGISFGGDSEIAGSRWR